MNNIDKTIKESVDKVIIEKSNDAIEERLLDYKKAVLALKYGRKNDK